MEKLNEALGPIAIRYPYADTEALTRGLAAGRFRRKLSNIELVYRSRDTPGSKDCVFAAQRILDILHTTEDSCQREAMECVPTPFDLHNIGVWNREDQLAAYLDIMRNYLMDPNSTTHSTMKKSWLDLTHGGD